jgi:hypothetical protein
MRTRMESTRDCRQGRAVFSGADSGLALYLLTISGEVMLGASVRWLLVYLGAATVGAGFPSG